MSETMGRREPKTTLSVLHPAGRQRQSIKGLLGKGSGGRFVCTTSYQDEARRLDSNRFDAMWMPEPNSGCWLWLGSGSHGYGYFWYGQAPGKAHRYSYERARGPIPDGMWILHKCDVRCCVNPDHLVAGTHQENMDHAVARGRTARGERKSRLAKLSAADIPAIRSDPRPAPAVAKDLGVHPGTIHSIRQRKNWKHIP